MRIALGAPLEPDGGCEPPSRRCPTGWCRPNRIGRGAAVNPGVRPACGIGSWWTSTYTTPAPTAAVRSRSRPVQTCCTSRHRRVLLVSFSVSFQRPVRVHRQHLPVARGGAAVPRPVNGLPITVGSAGTSGLSGHEMDAPSALALRELGDRLVRPRGPSPDHRPGVLGGSDPDGRLGTALDHPAGRAAGVPARVHDARVRPPRRRPADHRGRADGESLRARVAQVADQRGLVEPGPPGSDDIGDPFGGGLDVARGTVAVIDTAVDGVLHALGVRRAVVSRALTARWAAQLRPERRGLPAAPSNGPTAESAVGRQSGLPSAGDSSASGRPNRSVRPRCH